MFKSLIKTQVWGPQGMTPLVPRVTVLPTLFSEAYSFKRQDIKVAQNSNYPRNMVDSLLRSAFGNVVFTKHGCYCCRPVDVHDIIEWVRTEARSLGLNLKQVNAELKTAFEQLALDKQIALVRHYSRIYVILPPSYAVIVQASLHQYA